MTLPAANAAAPLLVPDYTCRLCSCACHSLAWNFLHSSDELLCA
jgi:hypothetical protein